jgi:hypothetical protein
LYAAAFAAAIVRRRSIDDVKESWVILIEGYLKIGRVIEIGNVHSVPFNVKGAVRRGPGGGGENTASFKPRLAAGQDHGGHEVGLIRENGRAESRIRVRAECVEVRCTAVELQIAIGTDIRSSIGRPIQGDWERKRDRGCTLIAMVPCVGIARHNRGRRSACNVITAHARGATGERLLSGNRI